MRILEVESIEGKIKIDEVINRNNAKEYVVWYKIATEKRSYSFTYKTIKSAMNKYKKVANIMINNYLTKCN